MKRINLRKRMNHEFYFLPIKLEILIRYPREKYWEPIVEVGAGNRHRGAICTLGTLKQGYIYHLGNKLDTYTHKKEFIGIKRSVSHGSQWSRMKNRTCYLRSQVKKKSFQKRGVTIYYVKSCLKFKVKAENWFGYGKCRMLVYLVSDFGRMVVTKAWLEWFKVWLGDRQKD